MTDGRKDRQTRVISKDAVLNLICEAIIRKKVELTVITEKILVKHVDPGCVQLNLYQSTLFIVKTKPSQLHFDFNFPKISSYVSVTRKK